MSLASAVALSPARGEARLGRSVVVIARGGANGELQVGGPDGPTLRPITFSQRDRVAACAARSAVPRDELCAGILAASMVRGGRGERTVHEIIALMLAGAGIEDAPGFAECAFLVARGTGWDYQQLANAEAAEIDRLASHLSRTTAEPRWSRLIFTPERADELEAIRVDLADNLLCRAGLAASEVVETGGQTPERHRQLSETSTAADRHIEFPPAQSDGAEPSAESAERRTAKRRMQTSETPVAPDRRIEFPPAQFDGAEPSAEPAVVKERQQLARVHAAALGAKTSAAAQKTGVTPRQLARIRFRASIASDVARIEAPPEEIETGTTSRTRDEVAAASAPGFAHRTGYSPSRLVGGSCRRRAAQGAGAVARTAARHDSTSPSFPLIALSAKPELATAAPESRGAACPREQQNAPEVADALAALLDDEADLRGIAR